MKVNKNINSDILIWAVERAGLSPEEISQKIPKFSAWL
jgi:hypothetical protein